MGPRSPPQLCCQPRASHCPPHTARPPGRAGVHQLCSPWPCAGGRATPADGRRVSGKVRNAALFRGAVHVSVRRSAHPGGPAGMGDPGGGCVSEGSDQTPRDKKERGGAPQVAACEAPFRSSVTSSICMWQGPRAGPVQLASPEKSSSCLSLKTGHKAVPAPGGARGGAGGKSPAGALTSRCPETPMPRARSPTLHPTFLGKTHTLLIFSI